MKKHGSVVSFLGHTIFEKMSAHKYTVVLSVTVLHGGERCLGSGIDLARKRTNITGIVTVGPLRLLQQRKEWT